MILYLLAGAFALGLLAGGGGMKWWDDDASARKEAALQAAQKKVEDAALEARQAAADHIVDMTAAYDAGEANARTVTRTVYVKGQSIVANTPAFTNPACVAGDDALKLLNGARAGSGVQLAANTGGADAALPAAGPATGRQDGDPISGSAAGRGDVPNVQSSASGTGSGGQVSGTGAGRVHPKPKPIK